ncbi:GCN5 family acetyltransferase [Agrobacterium sp. TS43]|uniref:GNAT family N-acetyltransferase n=1 Tax=Agrobacterium TaxID=357 RepID=UPI000362F64F|nr:MULTISPECIES: GNAT family N-acetyltransferase [Agrobacterium]EPR07824.1 GCN5 family acetyltransferase [Agrobacterium radiobacter DSM 30147]KDR87291.1 GCN5 family acetyltransferase [Agrobacterium tumefaciens GW4]KVK40674.1 GCN5 family acetyltransferase [Agrobacterium sp. JL28]KVK40951.1 GCN5 family acetyltransferase [Agrobacterium sp. LY4]KVK55282.1 GCN5 family acetyltransferase [Agrobacterium sp. TS45]
MNWEPAIFEITRDGYVLSTDPARVDFDLVHGFLARDSYWAQGMTADRLKRALSHSLPVGVYAPDGSMAAFARLVTDYAVFGYLRDVFTVEDHRGRGLASWIATEIRTHPELSTVSSWMLATRDAHGVYEKAGYRAAPHPEYYMTVPKPGEG